MSKKIFEFYTVEKLEGETRQTIKCNQCDHVFDHKATAERHVQTHLLNRTKHKCPKCPKEYTDSSTLRDHIKTNHSGKSDYLCEECGKSFRFRSNLFMHKRRHNEDRRFSCDMCSQTFYTKERLHQHQKSHISKEEKGEVNQDLPQTIETVMGLVSAIGQKTVSRKTIF
jgi:uncharacterized Zn-finger protein